MRKQGREPKATYRELTCPPLWAGHADVQPWTSQLGWLVDTVYLPVLTSGAQMLQKDLKVQIPPKQVIVSGS